MKRASWVIFETFYKTPMDLWNGGPFSIRITLLNYKTWLTGVGGGPWSSSAMVSVDKSSVQPTKLRMAVLERRSSTIFLAANGRRTPVRTGMTFWLVRLAGLDSTTLTQLVIQSNAIFESGRGDALTMVIILVPWALLQHYYITKEPFDITFCLV